MPDALDWKREDLAVAYWKLAKEGSDTTVTQQFGFDPENLTFDGVEICADDEIQLYNGERAKVWYVATLPGSLYIRLSPGQWMTLKNLNITAHFRQKNRFELLQEELLELEKHNDKTALDEYYKKRTEYENIIEESRNLK